MKLNLQFFADEEVSTGESTESVNAGQMETVGNNVGNEATEGTATSEETKTAPKETQSSDMNAIYANMRRKAEADEKRKQDALNAIFAEEFKGYVNPRTNKPILTAQDYIEAWREQKVMAKEAELKEKGIDTNTINEIVANSPQMQEYKQMLDYYKNKEREEMLQKDLADLHELDPNITTLETVPKEVWDDALSAKTTLTRAYKNVFFGKINDQKASAIQQRTINQISGKAHLAPVNGVVQNTNEVEIPADQLASWKEWYPNLSEAELRKKYNRVINH